MSDGRDPHPRAPTKHPDRDARNRSFGQNYRPTKVDDFGVWLSSRRIRAAVGSFEGKCVADVGCGYHATFSRTLLDVVGSLILIDVAIDPEVGSHRAVTVVEGTLPEVLDRLPDSGVDVIICNSVLEHLWEPDVALGHFHRALVEDGIVLVNVPSWRGKRFLELAAFRLAVSPADEMDDHKTYYDPPDLWPLLVRAGFLPHRIRCFKHKFGLNTFAASRKGGRPGVM